MSEQVESRLAEILDGTDADPFGNVIPPSTAVHPEPSTDEVSAARLSREGEASAVVARIGEPIQANAALIARVEDADSRWCSPAISPAISSCAADSVISSCAA